MYDSRRNRSYLVSLPFRLSAGLSNDVHCLAPVADCGSFGCLALAAGGAICRCLVHADSRKLKRSENDCQVRFICWASFVFAV